MYFILIGILTRRLFEATAGFLGGAWELWEAWAGIPVYGPVDPNDPTRRITWWIIDWLNH